MKSEAEKMYDEKYFENQKKVGKFGGIANQFKFCDYIGRTSAVLDFGCGGGYLLNELHCKERYGVEINEYARKVAIENGVKCFERLEDIPDKTIDVIISNHCLEHTTDPYKILCDLKRVIKSDGIMVIVVPNEIGTKVNLDDKDHHLFSWTVQNLKNLVSAAGWEVIRADCIRHRWPNHYWLIQRF